MFQARDLTDGSIFRFPFCDKAREYRKIRRRWWSRRVCIEDVESGRLTHCSGDEPVLPISEGIAYARAI